MDTSNTPSGPEVAQQHASDVCTFCGEDIIIRCSREDLRTQCKLDHLSEDLCLVAGALERIADAAAEGNPPTPAEALHVVGEAGQRITDAAARIQQFANITQSGEGAMIDIPNARLRNGKLSRRIVDSLHIRTMVAAYHHHFSIYRKNKKSVTQLIPGKVWKLVYGHYKKAFPTSPFQEETLKDRLRDTLKDLKAINKEQAAPAPGKVASQTEEVVLVRSKSPDAGDAIRNVLKRSHSPIDGTTAPLASTSSASSTDRSDDGGPPAGPASPRFASSEKPMAIAQQMSQQQGASLASIEKQFQESSQKRNALLGAKLDRQKIANLKSARDVGVITDDELKERVRKILRMSY